MARSHSQDTARGPQILERLLKEVADARIAVMMLGSWVEERINHDSKEYAQVNGLLKKQENFNRDATAYFQAVEDEEAENSVVGVRTLRHMEQVYARRQQQQKNLAERIRVAKENGNIISYTDYKQARKARQTGREEPKGVA